MNEKFQCRTRLCGFDTKRFHRGRANELFLSISTEAKERQSLITAALETLSKHSRQLGGVGDGRAGVG